MAQCSKCGFLSIWLSDKRSFEEAYQDFRSGRHFKDNYSFNTTIPACFVQKANLAYEYDTDESISTVSRFGDKVRTILEKPRNCDGYTPWMQGFHPKEHKEMLLNEQIVEAQRKNAQHSLHAAIATALFTGLAVVAGSIVTYWSADLTAKATLEAVKMQIESDREIAKLEISKPSPPINVVVQIPDPAASKKSSKK